MKRPKKTDYSCDFPLRFWSVSLKKELQIMANKEKRPLNFFINQVLKEKADSRLTE